MLDSGAEGPGFKLQPRRCNNLSQTVHTHRASVHQAAKLVAALLRVAGVTAGLAESNGSGIMTHVTCRLTAKNRDPLRNHTLGYRAWATFTYLFALETIGVASYGALGHVPTLDFNNLFCSTLLWSYTKYDSSLL